MGIELGRLSSPSPMRFQEGYYSALVRAEGPMGAAESRTLPFLAQGALNGFVRLRIQKDIPREITQPCFKCWFYSNNTAVYATIFRSFLCLTFGSEITSRSNTTCP